MFPGGKLLTTVMAVINHLLCFLLPIFPSGLPGHSATRAAADIRTYSLSEPLPPPFPCPALSPEFLSPLQPHCSYRVPRGLGLPAAHICLLLSRLQSTPARCFPSGLQGPGEIEEAGDFTVKMGEDQKRMGGPWSADLNPGLSKCKWNPHPCLVCGVVAPGTVSSVSVEVLSCSWYLCPVSCAHSVLGKWLSASHLSSFLNRL